MKKLLTIVFLLLASVAVSQADYPVGSQLNIDGSTLGWDDTAKKWRPVAVDANGNLKTDSGGTTQEISVDTSNIESYLKEVDGEDTITITDLINGIGTDTKNIENKLKVDDKTVTELINGIGTDTSNIESYLKKIDGNDTTTITDFIEEIKDCLKISINPYNYSVIDRLIILTSNSENTKTEVASISHNIGNLLDDTITDFRTSRLSVSASTATQVSPLTNVDSTATKRVFVELRAIDPDDEFYIGFANTVTDSNGRPVKGRILLNMSTVQNLYVYHTNASALAIQQTEGWK